MLTKFIARGLLFSLALLLSIAIGAVSIPALATHPFTWEKIDVDLQLVESGDLLVTETQKYVFTRYTNQRTRYIKLDRIDDIKDITVTEKDRPVADLKISTENGKKYIRWQHAIGNKFPETHTFILKYRVVGGLEVGESQTKFKWMAIFPDRQTSINSAAITLHLPDQLLSSIQNFNTNGVTVNRKIIDANTVQFIANKPIAPQSHLAILGEFPSNYLSLKPSQWQTQQSSGTNWLWWWWVPFAVFSLLGGGSSSSANGGGGGGGGGDGGDGGGCGGCGGCGGGD